MIDLDRVETAEITIDPSGKVWINLDGKCALRIGHAKTIVVTDARGEFVMTHPKDVTDQFAFDLPARPGAGGFVQSSVSFKRDNNDVISDPPALEPRRDANGNEIPWPKDADYFMAFDPDNPDIPTD